MCAQRQRYTLEFKHVTSLDNHATNKRHNVNKTREFSNFNAKRFKDSKDTRRRKLQSQRQKFGKAKISIILKLNVELFAHRQDTTSSRGIPPSRSTTSTSFFNIKMKFSKHSVPKLAARISRKRLPQQFSQ